MTPMQELFSFLDKYHHCLTPSTVELMKDVYLSKEKSYVEQTKLDGKLEGIKLLQQKIKKHENI